MSTPSGLAAKDEFSRKVLDAIPLPVLVVDNDVGIIDYNEAAEKLLGQDRQMIFRKRGGEALHCIHSTDVPEGCGQGEFCKDCIVRQSVTAAFQGQKLVRQKTRMELVQHGKSKQIELLVTTSPFKYGGADFVLLILEDISELITLRGLLPICSKCKKIRDDRQYWHSLESYMVAHLNVDLTHSLCPDCLQEYLRINRGQS